MGTVLIAGMGLMAVRRHRKSAGKQPRAAIWDALVSFDLCERFEGLIDTRMHASFAVTTVSLSLSLSLSRCTARVASKGYAEVAASDDLEYATIAPTENDPLFD